MRLAVASGLSTVTTTSGTGQIVALTFASFTRNPGAQVSFAAGSGQTLGTASNQITFTTAPTAPALTNSVLIGATTTDATSYAANTTGFNLATYGGSGVAPALQISTALPTSGAQRFSDQLHRHDLDGHRHG